MPSSMDLISKLYSVKWIRSAKWRDDSEGRTPVAKLQKKYSGKKLLDQTLFHYCVNIINHLRPPQKLHDFLIYTFVHKHT